MKVVIAWDRARDKPPDIALAHSILDMCKSLYPKVRIILKGSDRGIGLSIKRRLTDPEKHTPVEMDWTEVVIIHHLLDGEMPKIEFSNDYDAVNAALVDLGDEFHIISEAKPRGVTMNLLRRVIAAHRPYALYKPGELVPKKAQFDERGGIHVNQTA